MTVELTQPTECRGDLLSFTECYLALPAECNASGEPTITGGSATVNAAYGNEAAAYQACSVCAEAAGDTTCDTCRKTSCCAEWRAYLSGGSAKTMFECELAHCEGKC